MSLTEEVPKALGLRVGLRVPLTVFNLTHESCTDTQVNIQTNECSFLSLLCMFNTGFMFWLYFFGQS